MSRIREVDGPGVRGTMVVHDEEHVTVGIKRKVGVPNVEHVVSNDEVV